jgi:hypothetical protein
VQKKDISILKIFLKDNEYYMTLDYDLNDETIAFDHLNESHIEELIRFLERIVCNLKEFGLPFDCYSEDD